MTGTRFVSLLEGRYAREWLPFGLGDHRRAYNPAEVRPAPPSNRRFCSCGIEQELCASCGIWVCRAPGHLRHTCAGAP